MLLVLLTLLVLVLLLLMMMMIMLCFIDEVAVSAAALPAACLLTEEGWVPWGAIVGHLKRHFVEPLQCWAVDHGACSNNHQTCNVTVQIP